MRNCFLAGHGTPTKFLSTPNFPDFQHRFRFAWLEGCEAFSWANFVKFGALWSEIPAFGPGPQESTGPGTAPPGCTPGAFVGYICQPQVAYLLSTPITVGGVEYDYQLLARHAVFHSTFILDWVLGNRTLLDSIGDASDAFNQASIAEPTTLCRYLNSWTTYEPANYIKIGGYTELKVNEYNKLGL